MLLDVTPLSLAVEVEGGIAHAMIPRNTTIPAKKSNIYTTAADNQNAVTIHVTQGERQFSRDNKSLGMFNLEGIPMMTTDNLANLDSLALTAISPTVTRKEEIKCLTPIVDLTVSKPIKARQAPRNEQRKEQV